MQLVTFGVGIIIGLLVRDVKLKTAEKFENYKEWKKTNGIFFGKAQFGEPISEKEKWENANNIDDLLN